MSTAQDCGGCMSGDHGKHNRNHGIHEGLIGGTYCACTGDCAERAAAATAFLMEIFAPTPHADRATDREPEEGE